MKRIATRIAVATTALFAVALAGGAGFMPR